MNGPLTILIVGGYGTFGGRIVALLEGEPGLTLIIAGRSLERARAFREARGKTRATLIAAAFDRDGGIDQAFASPRPDVLVDASGPFQAYGERPYRLIEACIAHGVNYLDLADGSDFVAGVRQFEARASAAGVFVLSGVSSFPVLTAAVVRHLASGLARVDAIRGGIAPSPFADVGENVIRAIAGYAGKPVRLRRDGVEAVGYPFAEHMRFTIAPPGSVPLRRRWFSLVDVPDLLALTELWPDAKSIWMGAAPVPEMPHRALALLALLVRFRLVPSLSRLAPLMSFTMKHVRWGEHRGGMFVEIDGTDTSGVSRKRSWHMVAEGDDGPLIPAMAVAAVVRKSLIGNAPPPGARACTRDLELGDYDKLFAGRAIVWGIRDDHDISTTPLYSRVLGQALDRLPAEIQAMHAVADTMLAEGRAVVERGTGVLARLAAAVIGFPPAAPDTSVNVRFDVTNGTETWTRTFGGKSFSSRQFAGRGNWEGLLCERFGPLTFAIALVADKERLTLVLRGWSLFGVSMPMWLCPRSTAYETAEAGKFHFHVEISHKITGLIVRYRGWLVPLRPSALAKTAADVVTPAPHPGLTARDDNAE